MAAAAPTDAAAAPDETWFCKPPYGGEGQFTKKYAASCFCKRVRFEVDGDPLVAKLCDCSVCMRLHGAPMQWAALFPKKSVRFTKESEPWLSFYDTAKDAAYDSGATRTIPCKVRCKHCGTPLADEGRNMFMAFPTVFEFVSGGGKPEFPSSFLPSVRIFCASRALMSCDGLPSYLDDCKTPLSIGDFLCDIAPSLDGSGYKGQAGRIGVLGGSVDFAGAPYYAGMAALRVGAELLYLCTALEATGPIKSYSPELMVSEVYRWSRMSSTDAGVKEQEQERMIRKMEALLPRFHALTIGPGLGRDDAVLAAVAGVIEKAKARNLPLVIDADGLWLIERRPELVKGYGMCVLTPNAAEYRRLAEKVTGNANEELSSLCAAMGGPVILQKGAVDRICAPDSTEVLTCSEEGAPRRPGGLGDFLSGSLAVLLGWAALRRRSQLLACQAACTLVRRACRMAFAKRQRAMVAPDVLEEVGSAFQDLCRPSIGASL